MNFPADNSTQTNTALATTGTSATYADSNDLSTKQNVLTASTNLLGIGTSISALNYSSITVNRPTNFQSDWNSTVINKPTNFQADWNSTVINKPTNFQSDWNSTIINKPDLTVYAIKTNVDSSLNSLTTNKQNNLTFTSPLTNTSNTISIDLSAYPLKTNVDSSLNSLNTNKQNNLTFTSPLTNTSNTISIDLSAYPLKTNVDSSLNSLNTNKQNVFTCITPLIKNDISNNIRIDLSSYSTTGNDTNYVLKSGGTMSGLLTVPNITLGSNGKINSYDDYHYIQISQPTDTLTIQEFGTITFNIGPTKTQKAYINSTGLTVVGATSLAGLTVSGATSLAGLTTTGNIDCGGGIAITGSNAFAWEADIADAASKTNTYINFRNATASSDWCYLRQIGTTNAFKMALDFHDDGNDARFCIRNVQSTNNPDTITEVFTVDNGNVIATGNIRGNDLTAGDATYQIFLTKPSATDPAKIQTIQQGVGYNQNLLIQELGSGTVSIGTSSVGTYKLNVNGSFNATSIYNNGTLIDFSTYATSTNLTNYYNKTDSDARYLQLSGGTLTGNLEVSKSNPILTIRAGGESQTAILYISTPYNSATPLRTAILSEGIGSWSRSKLHFCLNNTTDNLTAVSIADARMTILPSGNIGIGITTPMELLSIGSPLINGSDGAISLSKRNLAGNGFRNFRMGIDSNFHFCIGDFGSATSGNTWRSTDFTINYFNGNVGVGTSNQSYKLSVNGSLNATSIYNNGTLIDFNSYLLKSGGTMTGQLILTFDNNPLRIKSTLSSANNCIQILNDIDKTAYIGVAGSTFGGNYQNNFFIESATGSIILNTNGRTSASTPNMIINNDGNVGIGTNDPKCKLQINGIVNITNTSPYATANNNMQGGSLTIGDTLLDYGGGTFWNGGNAAGLMMECANNTEIVVHDSGNRLASLMYYEGGGTNKITIGRNMGWTAISDVVLNGNVTFTGELKSSYWKFTNQSDYCRLYNSAGTDYFNFAAKTLYASGGASINGGDLNIQDGYAISFGGGDGRIYRSGGQVYIEADDIFYFKSTTANKTITFNAGSITTSTYINIGSYLNIADAVGGYITFANKWRMGVATANGITNSLVFWHNESGFNSYWWFNGTQTTTQSEISDERIKKEINDIETPLNKIMSLKPKEYYLCDDKDYNKKFGIIAQDVENVFPELIHNSSDYIADIYSYAKYENGIITLDKDISNLINIDDEIKIILDNNDKNNLEIAIDDTPYNNRYKRRFVKVVDIIDNHSFKIDIELEMNDIFIYGKKVPDFKRLDYESLYCLNIAGTQELYKLIQQQNIIIQDLQKRIDVLENK